jgi:hypothetical protein
MKKINIIVIAILVLVFHSCQTNEIIFPYSALDTNTNSEVRILNVIPVTGNSDTLLLNGKNYSSVSTVLGNYYPSSAPKYFASPIGATSISIRFVAKTTAPAMAAFNYAGNMTLAKGKWSAFIYDKTKDPILLQDADVVPTTDAWNDTVCFIKVANFFHKADGVTPFGKITLKAKKDITGAAWETVATDIEFGTQTTAYYQYKLKNVLNKKPWTGTEDKITFAIFDSAGTQYQQFTSATTSAKAAHSSTSWSLGKGRAYVIYVNGKEGTTNNTDQFIRFGNYNPL